METIVLSGAGPRIKVRVPAGTKRTVTVVTNDKVTNVALSTNTDLKFKAA